MFIVGNGHDPERQQGRSRRLFIQMTFFVMMFYFERQFIHLPYIAIKLPTDVNPRYVLRNWMAESATRKAEMNNFSEVCVYEDGSIHCFGFKPNIYNLKYRNSE